MEKRRFKRVKLRVKAHFKCRGASGRDVITRDLSVKGAFLESDRRPPLGEVCDITFLLTDEDRVVERVRLKARVVRREEGGFAVEFEEIPLPDFITLKRMVALNDTGS